MSLRSILTGIASLALLAVTVYAAGEIKLDDVKCVMNPKAAAKAENFVEYKGGKVFFCCQNCPKAFQSKVKEDDVVAAKGNAQLVATEQAKQAKCPFTGQPLNKEATVEVVGAKIAFCCTNCKGKAEKLEGEAQLVALFGEKAYKTAGFEIPKEEER